jgi:hypothetical protein
MSPDQARALLELMADLYRVANQPAASAEPAVNGQVEEPARAAE